MSPDDFVYWPFDVAPVEQLSEFHKQLNALLKSMFEAGHAPHISRNEMFLGFGTPELRGVEFFLRSGRNRFWEPQLTANHRCIRLGPLFSLPYSTCIVIDGIENVSIFTHRWLDGESIESTLEGIDAFDHMTHAKALRLPNA